MTKSELIEQITARHTQLSAKDIEFAVKAIINYMTDVLAEGGRIEIRGFGSFSFTTENLGRVVIPRPVSPWC